MRTLLINTIVFIVLLALVEGFFQLNAQHKFVSNAGVRRLQAQWIQWNYERNQDLQPNYLTLDEFTAIYGEHILKIPPRYSAEKTYDWDLLNYPFNPTATDIIYSNNYYPRRTRGEMANQQFHLAKIITTELGPPRKLYELDYSYDENSLRKTVSGKTHDPDAWQVLALGDSLTLGEAVADEHTYPSQLDSKLSSGWKVQNFGWHGYSINDLYHQIVEKPQSLTFLKGTKSIAIWRFIPAHLGRAFCHISCLANTRSPHVSIKPLYYLNGDGELVDDGTPMSSTRPSRVALRWLSYSEFIRFFNITAFDEFSDDEIRTFAKLLIETRNEFRKYTDVTEFYFVFEEPFSQQKQLLALLNEAGIKAINYSRIPFWRITPRSFVPQDYHPTSEQHWIFTELLKKDVFENDLKRP